MANLICRKCGKELDGFLYKGTLQCSECKGVNIISFGKVVALANEDNQARPEVAFEKGDDQGKPGLTDRGQELDKQRGEGTEDPNIIKVIKDWYTMTNEALCEILSKLGENTEGKKRPELIQAMKEAVDMGLVKVIEEAPQEENNGQAGDGREST